MKLLYSGLRILLFVGILHTPRTAWAADAAAADEAELSLDDEFADDAGDAEAPMIADPIAPFNRAMFAFNDKFYFWLLKPAARGYKAVVPEMPRRGILHAFHNLRAPIRIVNSLLQGKFGKVRSEAERFVLNSTFGCLGLDNAADDILGEAASSEDTGQTLGKSFHVGEGLYIVWPIFGPSNVRDTFGLIGDRALDPVSYAEGVQPAVQSLDTVNKTSFAIGDYEEIKQDALDPYTFVRDAYKQHRDKKLQE